MHLNCIFFKPQITRNQIYSPLEFLLRLCLLFSFDQASNLQAEDITALGISTMRGTFLTWDRYMTATLVLIFFILSSHL